MQLRVVHETTYDYAPAVRTAQHLAHLRPADTGWQRVLEHDMQVSPEPARIRPGQDAWGNRRVFFSLQQAHARLRVTAISRVRTSARPVVAHDLPWEDVRERMRYRRGGAWDPASEFAFASGYVPRHDEFTAFAAPSFTPGRPLMAAARDLAARIHCDFDYQAAATDAATPALKALALRRGVCQDFAHVMLGCLRSLGLPARYVSGYLLTQPPPGQPKLVGSDASHAWVAVYLPGLAPSDAGTWAEIDPTNNRVPGEDYVTLASGRDYADISPLRGVIHGGAHHTLRVAVTVEPLT
jgi:transglutaminase-like putative cysteine protease